MVARWSVDGRALGDVLISLVPLLFCWRWVVHKSTLGNAHVYFTLGVGGGNSFSMSHFISGGVQVGFVDHCIRCAYCFVLCIDVLKR